MEEQWRPCLGFERTHVVSNMGRVVRLPKVKGGKSRLLKTGSTRDPDNDDYVRVGLFGDGVRKTAYVHRLVAMAFVDGYEDGMEVNHINGDKTDNRAENLEWVTHQENQEHAARVLGKMCGPRPTRRRLTDDDVIAIRESGETQRALAERYGVSRVTIHYIRTGRIYKEVQEIGRGHR